MDLFKSKYSSMPDNSYFDKRMANGDKLSDIFDSLDFRYGCYSEDKARPITVRVGKLYNYVANNYILFDNWFVFCDDFDDFDKCSYAYRRFNMNGIREGGVIIRRDGSYVTREEFLDIKFEHEAQSQYAIVKQYDGLLNIVDVNKGSKLETKGIKADYIDYGYSGLFPIVIGELSRDEKELLWSSEGVGIANEKHLKFNFYNVRTGILSPSLWFDYADRFKGVLNNYHMHTHNHTIVCVNGKKNFINQNGQLLSERWFDVARIYYDGTGKAGILKSKNLESLPDEIGDNYDYNPSKFVIFDIDKYGRIKESHIE